MANDVDEFTIKYKVETGDAASKLDKFNEKVKKTGKGAHGAKGYVSDMGKEFASMATSAFKAAAVAEAVFKAVEKSIEAVVEAMKDYNEQSIIAAQTGIGALGQDVIARNLAQASGGRMTVANSRDAMKSVHNTLSQAYQDPTGSNVQNIKLGLLGVKTTGANGKIADTEDVMNQLGKRWSKMTKDMAEAEGELLELTPQATDAIRDLGDKVNDTSNVTLEMAQRQAAAAKAASELMDATNGIETDLSDLAKTLVDTFLPSINDFFKGLQEGTHNLATVFNKEGIIEGTKHFGRALWADLKERVGAGKDDHVKSMSEHLAETAHAESEEDHAKGLQVLQEQKDAAKSNNEASEEMKKTVNQFATAVSAMPGALTEQEAIAAWAGEAAKGMVSGGVDSQYTGSSGGSTHSGSGGSGNISGHASGFINSVAEIESNNSNVAQKVVDINTKKGTPAGGYFQIIDPTWKRYAAKAGIDTDKYPNAMSAPRDVQAKVAAQIPANQFGPRTQRMLHEKFGNFDRNQTLGTLDQQFAGGGPVPVEVPRSGGSERRGKGGPGVLEGASFDSSQKIMANRGIGAAIGVNGEQIARGEGVTGTDAAYALQKQRVGFTQKITTLNAQIAGAERANKPGLANQLRGQLFTTQEQLGALDKFGASTAANQNAGGPDRTQGMPTIPTPPPPVNITINSNQDPVEIAKHAGTEVHKAYVDSQSKHVI